MVLDEFLNLKHFGQITRGQEKFIVDTKNQKPDFAGADQSVITLGLALKRVDVTKTCCDKKNAEI